MATASRLSDIELAALIASKICHDVISPVGAICNGLDIFVEDDSQDAKDYALQVTRNVADQASARLQFARFAYGAAGSAGAMIDVSTAEQISRGYIGNDKHKLVWEVPPGHMPKNHVKLLLNLIASAPLALHRGGTITVMHDGTHEEPSFVLRCAGANAKPPRYLVEFVSGNEEAEVDAMSVQAYYTCRLAEETDRRIEILQDGDDILLVALPAN
jgi:histidine phosphotransferase ChpT